MSRWRDECKNKAAKFMERDHHMTFIIIDVSDGSNWHNLIAAAENGDDEAKRVAAAIFAWMKIADQADADDVRCVYCCTELQPQTCGGWSVAQDESGGFVAAICKTCIKRDVDLLTDRIIEQLSDEYNVNVHRMQ